MTNTKTVHVTCPSCHAQGEFTVYKSINTKESPALKEKVRDGSLFQFACPACGAKTTVDYPFLYHQPEDHYMINYGKLEDGAKALEMLRGKGVALKDWAAEMEKTTRPYVLRAVDDRLAFREKLFIFDAGLGDLFTIRTAGQIIDDAVLASLEYAVDHLHVSLLMVMGHEGCGAVALGAEQLDALIADSTSDPESSLESADAMAELDERIASSDSIVLRSVGMSVWQAREAELDTSEDFERVHVARTIEELVTRSEIIQDALAHDRLMIVGARYQLSTGKVEVLSF